MILLIYSDSINSVDKMEMVTTMFTLNKRNYDFQVVSGIQEQGYNNDLPFELS